MGKMDVKELLALIKSGEEIKSLKLFTANSALNKAGKVLELKHCRIARRQSMEKSGAPTSGSTDFNRPANHNYNFTLNMELKNKEIRKIHPLLVYEVNGIAII